MQVRILSPASFLISMTRVRIRRMNPRFAILFVAWIAPLVAMGGTDPYKEVMKESFRSRQPIVYARATEYGFGVQYWRGSPTGSGSMGLIGSLAGGWAGGIVGSSVDRLANQGPIKLAEEDAAKLGPLYERNAAQDNLEQELFVSLATSRLFTRLPAVRPLLLGWPTNATSFTDDPVLIVELYSSLTTDYRALQVTALVYELSPSEVDPKSKRPSTGRVYRNRFDYVSDLLPAPPAKTAEDIKTDVEAVEAKYQGRKLSKQEQAQMNEELAAAKQGTTLRRRREPLMDAWLKNDGARLREALKIGTAKVAEMLGKDLLDVTPIEIQDVDRLAWLSLRDAEVGRHTSVFVAGPFAGALISKPTDTSADYCEGIAFGGNSSKATLPALCPELRKR